VAESTAATSGGGGGGGAAAIAIIDSLFRCHRSNADDADDDDPGEEDGEDEGEDEERRRGGAASGAQSRRSLQPVVARLGGHWSSSSTEFLDEAATDHRRPQSRDLLEDRNSELWPQQRPPRLTSSAESVTEQQEADAREMRPKARLNHPVVGGWDSEQPPGAAEDEEQPAMVAGIPPLSSPDPSLSSIREAERPWQPSFRLFRGIAE
jgi:hypothetical protein